MNSPPKPRREVALCVSQKRRSYRPTVINGEEMVTVPYSGAGDMTSFESCLVEKAVSDLPTLASQVFTLYEGQNSELTRQQEELEKQLKLIKAGKENLSALNCDMKCLRNKIFLTEEFNNDTSKRIKCLDSDIQRLVTIIVNKETEFKHTKALAELEKRKLQEDIRKMQKHADLVEENIKSTSASYAKLQEIKCEVDTLRKQKKSIIENHSIGKDELLSGEVEKKLAEEIDGMKAEMWNFQNEAKLYETKIEEQKIKNHEIGQNIQVAHKRNTAQLTRLKKQVSDLQIRNNQREQQLIKMKNDMIEGEKRLTERQ